MSNFGTKVYEVLERIGQDAAWLASKTGISRAAISKWKTNGNRQPKPSSVKRVAVVLAEYGITMDELAEAAGYPLTSSASPDEREERWLALVRANKRLARVADRFEQLTPGEQDELLSLSEAWLSTRRRRSR